MYNTSEERVILAIPEDEELTGEQEAAIYLVQVREEYREIEAKHLENKEKYQEQYRKIDEEYRKARKGFLPFETTRAYEALNELIEENDGYFDILKFEGKLKNKGYSTTSLTEAWSIKFKENSIPEIPKTPEQRNQEIIESMNDTLF